jgi:syntaxin 1B/2/3
LKTDHNRADSDAAIQTNPYAQDAPAHSNNQYEMQDYSQQSSAAGSSLSQQEFLNRVQKLRDEIKGLTTDIDHIGLLHQRTLSSTDGSANHELEHYVSQTQIRNTAIKDGIKGLERDLAKTNDSSRTTKNTQLQSLKTFFKSELDKYQSVERDYEQRYRDQIARQYRIVNPDASEEEVREAANADWGNEGVFQTAVSNMLYPTILAKLFHGGIITDAQFSSATNESHRTCQLCAW